MEILGALNAWLALGLGLSAAGLLPVGTALRDGWRQRHRHRSRSRQRAKDLRARWLDKPATRPQELAWDGLKPLRLLRIEDEAAGVRSFYLAALDGQDLPPYRPGQFLNLRVPGPAGNLSRCYSLVDAPGQHHYRIAVKALPGGRVSQLLHRRLRPGDLVEAHAPAGDFCRDGSAAKPAVLIAGGIGIVPILSMLKAAATSGTPLWLLYGARSRSEMAFYTEIEACRGTAVQIRYFLEQPHDLPGCETGRPSIAQLQDWLPPDLDADFFLCGPPAMMSHFSAGLTKWDVPAGRIHSEAFGPAALPRPVRAGDDGASAHAVHFARSGPRVAFNGARTLLDLAESHGIAVDAACRAGHCGSCTTRVVQGSVRHTSQPGLRLAEDECLMCLARPRSDLQLDL